MFVVFVHSLQETGISGNFVGRIKAAKCPFDLQFLTWGIKRNNVHKTLNRVCKI